VAQNISLNLSTQCLNPGALSEDIIQEAGILARENFNAKSF
jgi:hypothetical protein